MPSCTSKRFIFKGIKSSNSFLKSVVSFFTSLKSVLSFVKINVGEAKTNSPTMEPLKSDAHSTDKSMLDDLKNEVCFLKLNQLYLNKYPG